MSNNRLVNRPRVVQLHAKAGILGFGLVAVFWVSSLVSLVAGDISWIVLVKRVVCYGMWAMMILIPLTAFTGLTLAGRSKNAVIARKRKRMRWMAPIGLLLLTFATYLYYKASHGEVDQRFAVAQVLELVIGLINISLLGLMIRDGFQLTRRAKSLPKRPPRSAHWQPANV